MIRDRFTRCLGIALCLSMAVSAQSNSSSQDTAGSSLCNSSISSANASGIYSFPVGIARADQDSYTNERVPDPSWAITVTGGDGESIERRYWYSTAGQDYADDIDINYDVCALIWSRLPINTIRLGQSDSGNCSTVFSERCIDGLTSKASSSALQWATYSSAPPFENLTAGVLPSICGYIFRDLLETMAENCTNEFGGTELNPMGYTSINAEALTGYNSSDLYRSECTPVEGNDTFHSVRVPTGFGADDGKFGTDAGYDNATQDITPILTMYMPVANTERTGTRNYVPTVLRCLQAKNFSEGSRVSPALAEGTPWPSPGGGLSAGAKGGITAGVVVFVLLVGGMLLSLWLIKRRKRRAREAAERRDESAGEDGKDLPPEADNTVEINELVAKDRKPELDSVDVVELGGGQGEPVEIASRTSPAELAAERH